MKPEWMRRCVGRVIRAEWCRSARRHPEGRRRPASDEPQDLARAGPGYPVERPPVKAAARGGHRRHCVVLGGGRGLAPDGLRWIACRPDVFLPTRVLARLFRRLVLAQLRDAPTAGKLHFFHGLAHRNLATRLGAAPRHCTCYGVGKVFGANHPRHDSSRARKLSVDS
jgi:hypothetical protein